MNDPANQLFDAAHKNRPGLVISAIQNGADPNGQHPRAGTLPLQVACQGNALESIAALIACGADPGKKFTRVSRIDGRTLKDHVPLMYVQSVEAARLLIEGGAALEIQDENQWTPLVWAAHAGNVAVFEYLLAAGAKASVTIHYAQREMSLSELLDRRIAELQVVEQRHSKSELTTEIDRLRTVRNMLT